MSTLNSHQNPVASSADDDPTGVRALLSALPGPDPMPDHLVERINASLAAAQAGRAASPSGPSATPLVVHPRRRPGRVLFAIAGAAAAVALIGVVGSNLLQTNQPTAARDSAAAVMTPSPRLSSGTAASPEVASGGAPQGAPDKAAPVSPSIPPLIQIRSSGTRYTQADFTTQARALHSGQVDPTPPMAAAGSAGVGTMGTAAGLTDCLSAIGAGGAQMVRADLAFYEGAPAVIIVATTGGIQTAYVVGLECSRTDAAVLRPATPLP